MSPDATPGWYPDPRGGDGLRYWTGESWAPDQSQPTGAQQGQQSDWSQQGQQSDWSQQGQQADWSAPGSYAATYLTSHDTGFDQGYAGAAPGGPAGYSGQSPYSPMFSPPTEPAPSAWRRGATWLALSAGIIAGFAAGFAVSDARDGGQAAPAAAISSAGPEPSISSAPPPSSRAPSIVESDEPSAPSASSAPPRPTDPEAPLLGRLGLRPTDVDPAVEVGLIDGGDGLDAATLDLCDGAFPSDSKRTARRQLAAADSSGAIFMSTEAVLYESAAAIETGFEELKRAAPSCKASTTLDKDWPQVSGVQRLTFDYTVQGVDGTETRSTAVYLRSGRTLLALYFRHPGISKNAVGGKTSLPEIVEVFARRLAAAPTAASTT